MTRASRLELPALQRQERGRLISLKTRDPWKYTHREAAGGDSLEAGLRWLDRAVAHGTDGLVSSGYEIGQGWLRSTTEATCAAARAMARAGVTSGRSEYADKARQLCEGLRPPSDAIERPIVVEHADIFLTLDLVSGLLSEPFAGQSAAVARLREFSESPLNTWKQLSPSSQAYVSLALYHAGMEAPGLVGAGVTSLTEAPSVELEEFFGELLAVSELARAKSDARKLQDLHRLVEDCMLRFERSKSLLEQGSSGAEYSSTVASARLALTLFMFAKLAGDPRYLNSALKLNEYLRGRQMRSRYASSAEGGMSATDPVGDGPSGWVCTAQATGLFVESLLREAREIDFR